MLAVACFLATFEFAVDRIAVEILPVYMGEGSTHGAQAWRERVRAALTALLELFDSEPDLAWLCVVETLKAGPAVLRRRGALLDTRLVGGGAEPLVDLVNQLMSMIVHPYLGSAAARRELERHAPTAAPKSS